MRVMKFGGTSVGSAVRMHDVARIIEGQQPVMVVLSAVSGTTNKLVEIAGHLLAKEKQAALNKMEQLQSSYLPFVDVLFAAENSKTDGYAIIQHYFEQLKSLAVNGFGLRQQKEVLAIGEMISTHLFFRLLQEQNKSVVLLNALDFMRVDQDGEPQMNYIASQLEELLSLHSGKDIYVTQGFICRNLLGEIDNLKRGGSDYSASLIGAAVGSDEIQIWTDIDGMHNNDPRVVSNTHPVRQLSFDEAAELAYFGAKILHPSSVNPARKSGIPVRLKNTMKPGAEGTLISDRSLPGVIKAVAAKDNIIAIRIVSNRMLLAHGFLRKVFEIFERYKTPIDMISTSEVAVSLTIDDDERLDSILDELNEIAKVEVDRGQTIICIVGDNIVDLPGFAAKIFDSLKSVSIRMVSCGGSRNNVSLLVATKNKNEALNALNVGLFNNIPV